MTPTLRRATSVLGLAALVVGVPAVLMAAVGWPLPRELPTPAEVAGALGDGWRPGGRFVLGVLALVGWALWAQLMRHVVAEARRLRLVGDEPPGPAGAGMSARLAAWLVGGLVLAAPMAPAVAAAPALPAVLSATRVFEHATPEQPPAAPVRVEVAPSPSYVVHTWAERQDCLWTIAERYLGDPFRWRELVALNAEVRQPSGQRLADDPRHWVYPGMQLRLPPDATGLDVVPPTEPAAPPVLAERAAPTPVPEAAESDRAATPLTAPTTVAPDRSAPTPAAPGGREPGTTDGGGSAEAPGGPIRLGRGAMLVAQALALGLPVFAAGGLVLRLNRRRRAQVARARPGRDIVRPDPAAEELERRARAIAADEAAEWVDAAVRVFAARLADAVMPAPTITCVRAGELGLEVLLAEPCDVAPPGFSVVDDGAVWRLDPELDLAALRSEAEKHPALTPALVSIGASPEGPLLVDLEALGVLSVEGAPERVRASLAGVALELASAPWAEGVDVRLLGPEPRLAALEGVEVADDPAALAAEVATIASSTAEAVGAERTTLAARLDPGGEAWFPTVVVAGAGTSAADVDALAAATRVGAGVALVAPGPVSGARWRLVIVDDGRARLEPLELVVHAAGAPPEVDLGALDPVAIEAAAGLLEAAARDEDVAPAVDVVEAIPVPERIARREDFELWVGVLGSVEVSGWAKAVGLRRKYEEIVAYLATHDGPVGGERLRAAVWPEKEIDPKSFREAMSRLRGHLGRDRGLLPPATAGAYLLGEAVGCDWTLFRQLVAAAAKAAKTDAAEAMALWREALALVRGEPFGGGLEDRGAYGWAYSELLVYDMQREITKAADDLAALALAAGDPDTTLWATKQGHLATPGQLSLFDWEMRVARHRLDPDGLKLAYRSRRLAEQALDPTADIDPELTHLYERLRAEIAANG